LSLAVSAAKLAAAALIAAGLGAVVVGLGCLPLPDDSMTALTPSM
jgi:hypothetical protein